MVTSLHGGGEVAQYLCRQLYSWNGSLRLWRGKWRCMERFLEWEETRSWTLSTRSRCRAIAEALSREGIHRSKHAMHNSRNKSSATLKARPHGLVRLLFYFLELCIACFGRWIPSLLRASAMARRRDPASPIARWQCSRSGLLSFKKTFHASPFATS